MASAITISPVRGLSAIWDESVMMSSVMPSLKNSCSESLLSWRRRRSCWQEKWPLSSRREDQTRRGGGDNAQCPCADCTRDHKGGHGRRLLCSDMNSAGTCAPEGRSHASAQALAL